MDKKWLLVPILVASLLVAPVTNAATPAYFVYITDEGGKATGSALIKEGIAYVSTSYWEAAGLRVVWDQGHKRAEYTGWEKKIAVRIGSKTGILDGKLVSLGGAPFETNGQLYVPADFLVKSLGGETVSWDAAKKIYTAKELKSFSSTSAKFGGNTYTVDKKAGRLYVTDSSGRTRLLANLGSELYDMVAFDFQKTPKGLIYLTLTDVYGEPHIHNKWYTLIIKDGGVIRQASVGYYMRYGNNVKIAGNQLLLTDGKTLRLIEDGTGNVTQTLDLTKLGGVSDTYLVEGMDDDFLLIRPNQQGFLMLIDRKTGSETLLYKELLDPEQQNFAETNDLPFFGDNLKFVKREGNALLFTNEYVRDGKVYKFNLSGNNK
ncbi:stalk domain-containing protein [Paenibacillus agri]|uniref:Copper amine oxidase N-terminal domain-containing protein n=1 Tax=Paenibacillus agri TaxID=2744309 RepID=A0A850EW18_9BACL|nr:stalk domain-containing protein [Paenibacillus agri]NUU62061.1 copper amine oxidase N-terminal domain-containing protein [Paenibacillus agri]